MINRLQLSNFKCFEDFSMDLKNVNIFAGINGMGKSTVIQSLLLLRQSYLQDLSIRKLYMNGVYAGLGTAQDILFDNAKQDCMEIKYSTDTGETYQYVFAYKQDFDYMDLKEKSEDSEQKNELFHNAFIYLSAYRIKPQMLYHITNEKELQKKVFANDGEYALQYLSAHGNDRVNNPNIVLDDKQPDTLMNQVRLWLDRISPGVSPQVKVEPSFRVSEVLYDFKEGKDRTNSYKSVNVGFGITYVLPIVIALVAAEKGDIIIIENPEAHIHPMGQRMLGELITLAGAGGAQIFVETHSDHIINGLRIMVKEKRVNKDNIELAYFYKDQQDDYRHKYLSIGIKDNGQLECWPDGFLDEWDKALYDLI